MRRRHTAPSYLFTVRVWPEALGGGTVEWRGRVQHVETGETRYFRQWQALVDFLVEVVARHHSHAGDPGGDLPSPGSARDDP